MAVLLATQNVDTAAWFCLNKVDLVAAAPRDEAFDDLPGVDGVFPYMEFATQQTIDLRWVMTGNVDPAGVPYSNPAAGLAANKRLFLERYYRVTRNDFGLVACAVTDVDGTGLLGQVKTRSPQFSDGLVECGVVMSVNIPAGELVEVGS
jgi:hypothetical protein